MKHRNFVHLCLVFLFLLVQGLVLAHGVEHDVEVLGPDHSCSLCISGHTLGAALPSQALALSVPPSVSLSFELPSPVAPARIPAHPRQRGPPLHS